MTQHAEDELPLRGQVLAQTNFEGYGNDLTSLAVPIDQANIITSAVHRSPMLAFAPAGLKLPFHKPVLDIDLPVTVLPSTTPGHFHLFIDCEMGWYKYVTLLDALANAHVIEQGYRDASVARGFSAVRLPWIRKEAPTPTNYHGFG